MTVREIMYTKAECPIVLEEASFRDALEELNRKGLGSVCVVRGALLVGIITDGDVRRFILSTQKPLPHMFTTPAGGIGSKAPKTIRPDATLEEGLEMFEKYQCWVLPVADDVGELIGLVHLHRLLKSLIPSG